MNKRWFITGLMITIGLGAAYLAWQGKDNKTPVETAQVSNTADKPIAFPPMDQLIYRKIETATFAMG